VKWSCCCEPPCPPPSFSGQSSRPPGPPRSPGSGVACESCTGWVCAADDAGLSAVAVDPPTANADTAATSATSTATAAIPSVRPTGRLAGVFIYITSFVTSGGPDHHGAPVTPL
jgi:hypothetical protein